MGDVIQFFQEEEKKMAITIFDVAKAFLAIDKRGDITHKKLQKLCYYAQSWSLTLHNKELFQDEFQAWVHGPVCPDLYQDYKHYGWQTIDEEVDIPEIIDDEVLEHLNMVYAT